MEMPSVIAHIHRIYYIMFQLAEDGFELGVEVGAGDTSLSAFFRLGLNSNFTSSAAFISYVHLVSQKGTCIVGISRSLKKLEAEEQL